MVVIQGAKKSLRPCMQVDVIESYDAFAALEASWNSLYQLDPDAQFFLSWMWLSRVFQEHPDQWRVLAVKPDMAGADYVGFLPTTLKTVWSKSRRRFRNEIHMAGRLFWAQYTGFVCHPNWEEQVIVSLAEKLKKMHWSRLKIKYFCNSESRINFFTDQFPKNIFRSSSHRLTINKGKTNNLVCPYIELPKDYETYLQTQLSSNTRQKIRRFTRQVEKADDLQIRTTNPDTIERDIDILMGLWVQTWAESKGQKTQDLAQTYRRILQHGFACGALHMTILWRDDTPLGALASLVDWQKRGLFFIVSGRDTSRDEPFIGWVLHAHSIRWAIENGIEIYDFCHGDEAYKYSYGAKGRHVKYVTVRTRSGVNLNGMLDPSCIDEVMADTKKFLETDHLEEARTACQQVLEVTRLFKWRHPQEDLVQDVV